MNLQKMLLQSAAAICAAGIFCSGLASVQAAAEELYTVGYYGDVSGDMIVDRTDVDLLEMHLRGEWPLNEETAVPYADLNKDGSVDARDLTLLKRLLLTGAEPEAHQEYILRKELIEPPIGQFEPSLPSVGDVNILLIAVEFPDCTFEKPFTADEVYQIAFGEGDSFDPSYPLESITAYYSRASYERLHLTGDVYQYTAKQPITYYQQDNGDGVLSVTEQNRTYMLLADEALTALDSQIDFDRFNANGDKNIDTIIFALPATTADSVYGVTSSEYWWPCSGNYIGNKTFDGLSPYNICVGGWALSDHAGFNSTWIHELGHAMGIPDYYFYKNVPEGESSEGLRGEAGCEMMDEAMGDMCAFDKLMFGWYAPDEVQIYSGGTQTFQLTNSQQMPSCVIIPRGNLDSFFEEYFIIEAVGNTGNNTCGFFGDYRYPLFQSGGIRILHCEATDYFDFMTWFYGFKWEVFSPVYDESNQKQRLLRLVNDGNGFFRKGAAINSSTSGFAWYDSSGNLTVDPGITISIDTLDMDTATITISQKS
ncbi:MAG: hypothetical protein IKQ91_03310 [Oscillospiraceae bacterium]|nr:hypothetical protein [Oscillospiraceae bacterium]